MDNMINKKVIKRSGKPFKSGNTVNTIKGIIDHPYREGKKAFTFYEDESCVSVEQCNLIEETK